MTRFNICWSPPALPLLTLLLALLTPAHGAVRLPAVLSDHMVLQRGERVPVWGWAAAQEEVSVQMGSQLQRTRAGKDGHWQIELDLSQGPLGPATLAVRGETKEILIQDVLVGEVWLASGQSNMEKPLGEQRGQRPSFNAEAEIAAADYPEIRLFKVSRRKAAQPAQDVGGAWVVCSPASIDKIKFSAAAYFFGQRLHKELKTPVGLIDSSWGGTRIEPWTPAWAAVAAPPSEADATASQLFNGMIAPLAPSAIKGVIWYQGESDLIESGDAALYTARMEALVKGWRRHWQSDFPFYYVQLAPHFYHLVRRAKVIDPEAMPRMWEAQADALRIPGTGMIVTTDLVDDLYDVHPRDKKSIGLRLANLALLRTYQRKDVAAFGPVFKSMALEADQAVLTFEHAEGLAARDGKALSWFDIAGADGRFFPGVAAIVNNKVILKSQRVPVPAAVRFAWDEAAQPNLVNRSGLPAMPFRSHRPASSAEPETFDVAVTVDDLPAHGALPAGMTRLGIADAHLATLRAHRVPEAFGFVNAAKLKGDPDLAAVLDAWRQAGHPLGNHTFSHMNLERAPSLAAWQDDVVAGEPAVASRMVGADWRYLRFPHLTLGTARGNEALAYLRGRGYRIADVSLSFDDWVYTEAYARCLAKGDTATIAAMKAQYLKHVDDGIASMKVNSRLVYGRIIPQVLLTHLGGWSAITLQDVMARLDAAGARYVTLAQAQADPAYAEPGGGNMINRTARQKGILLPENRSGEAGLDANTLCL